MADAGASTGDEMNMGPLGWVRRLTGRNEFDCNDIRENCSDYVDEELPAASVSKFRAHTDACADCNTFVSTFRATVMTLRDLPRRAPESDLQRKIRARIASEADAPGGQSGQTPTA